MWTGVYATAVSYTAYAAPLERIPWLAPPTVVAATGNGSSPWKRSVEKGREKESSLYKHQYARRNVTIFQHSVQCSSFISNGVRSVVSRTTIHPRDLCSPSMDLIVRQVMHCSTKVQTRDSIYRSVISWASIFLSGKLLNPSCDRGCASGGSPRFKCDHQTKWSAVSL